MLKTKFEILLGDTLGSLNSAIITLPQALAFGVATGFGAGAGIWGTIILCFIAGMFCKIPVLSGITGPATIVIASMMSALNADISSIILVIFMAGFLQIILAITSLPHIVKYVPYPVISGFMNGIGFIIIIMQLNPLLGFPIMSNTISSISAFIKNIQFTNMDSLFIGILTLIIVFAVPKKFNKLIPSQAIALVVCTLISVKMGLNVERISEISMSFPKITLPNLSLHNVITYFHYSVMLAVVLSAESLLTLLVSDSLLKTKTPSKNLLLGQGIGNMICSLTGSLPGSAATMRTVAAINTGSTTKLTSAISPLIIACLLFKFSAFVTSIPLAVLAGILIKIGYDIIDVKLLKVLKYAPKDDLYVLTTVFLLTVFYNLIVAVGAGITFAALLYAKRAADSAKLVQRTIYDKEISKMEKILEKDYNHKIRVVHIDGQFFFGSATQLVSQFEETLGTEYLILDYFSDNTLDISAIFALEDIILRLQTQKIKMILILKSEKIKEQFDKLGIINQVGNENVFETETEAINFAKSCIKDSMPKHHFWDFIH